VVVYVWLAAQVLALWAQVDLFYEMGAHVQRYTEAKHTYCGVAPTTVSPHGGAPPPCIQSPLWSTVFSQRQMMSPIRANGFPDVVHFHFTTSSSPPTFLILISPTIADVNTDVKPVYHLTVTRVKPPQSGDAEFSRHSHGINSFLMADRSREGVTGGLLEWQLELATSAFFHHDQRVSSSGIEYLVEVQDATRILQPLEQYELKQGSCDLEVAWKGFDERWDGDQLSSLERSRQITGITVLIATVLSAVLVRSALASARLPFNMPVVLVVVAKFFAVDFPQQYAFVTYLFAWYDAKGIKCQLCLFHPEHCDPQHPFHPTNLLLLALILGSALGNLVFVRPAKAKMTADDTLAALLLKGAVISVSILPFSSAFLVAGRSLVDWPITVHMLFMIPCAVGWSTIVMMVCWPFVFCCDD